MSALGDADSESELNGTDQEVVVIEPEKRMRARGTERGPSEAKKATDAQTALTKTVNHQKMASVISFVNTDRLLKARRSANLILFPTQEQAADPKEWRQFPQKSDPPQIQLLFQLKRVFERATEIEDDVERVKVQTKLLSEMNGTLNDVIKEAAEAAEQCRKILVDEQKMDLERQKNQGFDPSDVYKQAALP